MPRLETEANQSSTERGQDENDKRQQKKYEFFDNTVNLETSSALTTKAEFRELLDKKVFQKQGDVQVASLTLFDSAKDSANVELDAAGLVKKVSYPEEGKTREFGRDASGAINKLTTSTKDGKWDYVKEDGHWFRLDQQTRVAVSDFDISKNGEFKRFTDKGEVQVQGLDGKVVKEHQNAIGGQIRVNTAGQVEQVSRSDGSTLSATYEAGKLASFTESKDGKTTKFTRGEGNTWVGEQTDAAGNLTDDARANTAGKVTLKNVELANNGNLSFEKENGEKQIKRSNGGEIEEGAGKGKYTFDNEGRITAIENADGKKSRAFTYADRELNPASITINDKEKNESKLFQQITDGSGYAHFDAAGQRTDWAGNVKIRDDGTYCVQSKDSANNTWDAFYPDGKQQKEARIGDSISIYSPQGDLLSAKSKIAGSEANRELKANHDEKGLARVEIESQGKSTIFNRNADGTYATNLSTEYESVKNLKISAEGDVSFTRASGEKVNLKHDGTRHLDKYDGSFVDFDASDRATKAGLDQSNFRTYEYAGDQLSKVVEKTRAAGEKVWDASKPDGREFSTVSSDGHLSYQKQGKQFIEDTNLAKVELREDFQPAKLTMPNGANRAFDYDANNKLTKITDNRVTTSGTRTEIWNKVSEGPNNNELEVKNKFESQGVDGKVKVRNDVAVDGSGNVHYKSGDAQERIGRASDLLKAGDHSQSVEEAREHLKELASERSMNIERLTKYMDAFEKRAKDAAAEGIKGPSDEQIAKTYDKLSDLVKGKSGDGKTGEGKIGDGKDYFNDKERADLCEQALYNISSPKRINQGQNPTCNITTGEIFTASRNPEKYADTLKQVAVDGKLFTTTGKEIKLDRQAYTASPDEKLFDPDTDYRSNCRNWASHIMENAGINAFTQFAPKSAYMPTWGYPYSGTDQNGRSVNPMMGGPQIQQAVKELWGGDMPYIEHGVTPTAEQLWAYKQDGNFPVGIPTLYARDQNGNVGEQHVQTIHDVREVNGQTQVYLDDQSGQDAGWQSLAQVYARQGLQGPAERPRGPRISQRR